MTGNRETFTLLIRVVFTIRDIPVFYSDLEFDNHLEKKRTFLFQLLQ